MVPAGAVSEISECGWEQLFPRFPECEPAETNLGTSMGQFGSQWLCIARNHIIRTRQIVRGVRRGPMAPEAISGASDEDLTCIYTGEVHGTTKYPA